MPPLPSEERILTVFADIHYYFSAPTLRPERHRFDKGSYLYIYYDASQHKGRIEVANNPGTQCQDAFYGALDNVHVRHSTRFPTLCTLTVDVQAPGSENFPPPPNPDPYDWRLPTNDPRDEGDDLQRLHTLDIYFWTPDDSNQFMDSVERILSHARIESDRHHVSPTDNAMSTVVRKLENVAVTDPGYQNGHTRNSQEEPTKLSPESQTVPTANVLPPPPPGIPQPTGHQQTTGAQPVPEQQKEPVNFTPLPYNPVAPAAPEPIQHREKTPPPVDGAGGTGLAAAAAADHGISYNQHIPGSASFAPPPTQAMPYSVPGAVPASYASPPPSAGLTHSGSLSTRSSMQQSPGAHPYQSSFMPGVTQQVSQPSQMSFAPPPADPNTHFYSQNMYGIPPGPQKSYTAPVGGFSNYSYEPAPQRQASVNEYDIHNQLYRPTEAEANSYHQQYAQQAMRSQGQRGRKLEDGAARVESGVNRFLKKLERKL